VVLSQLQMIVIIAYKSYAMHAIVKLFNFYLIFQFFSVVMPHMVNKDVY